LLTVYATDLHVEHESAAQPWVDKEATGKEHRGPFMVARGPDDGRSTYTLGFECIKGQRGRGDTE
jgi:hypothetical protein